MVRLTETISWRLKQRQGQAIGRTHRLEWATSIETPSPSRDRQGRYGVATRNFCVRYMQAAKPVVSRGDAANLEPLHRLLTSMSRQETRFDPIPPPFGPCPTENSPLRLVVVAAAIEAKVSRNVCAVSRPAAGACGSDNLLELGLLARKIEERGTTSKLALSETHPARLISNL